MRGAGLPGGDLRNVDPWRALKAYDGSDTEAPSGTAQPQRPVSGSVADNKDPEYPELMHRPRTMPGALEHRAQLRREQGGPLGAALRGGVAPRSGRHDVRCNCLWR